MVVIAAAAILFWAALQVGLRLIPAALRRLPTPEIRWVEDAPPPEWEELLPTVFPQGAGLAEEPRRRFATPGTGLPSRHRVRGRRWFRGDGIGAARRGLPGLLSGPGNGAQDPFPDTRRVIIYPQTFVPRRPSGDLGFELNPDEEDATLGESWHHGTVILSWPSVVAGARNPDDGWNVVFHEFAHQLDQSDGDGGGIPVGLGPEQRDLWRRIVDDRLSEIRSDLDSGREPYLDDYAATNEAEFFAVAAETFFEVPDYLEEVDEELHRLMCSYFGRPPLRRNW